MTQHYIQYPGAAHILCVLLCVFLWPVTAASAPPVAFDIDRAIEICDSVPLDNLEGVWLYPEDNVTVLVLRTPVSHVSLPEYEITVVESTDCNLNPGDRIGRIFASSDNRKFTVELLTERKANLLLKPKTCAGTLSSDGYALTLRHKKEKFRIRFNLNPSVLLPRLWRSMLRIGTSPVSRSDSDDAPEGMVKIYPSYDGNGSSHRQPRYL